MEAKETDGIPTCYNDEAGNMRRLAAPWFAECAPGMNNDCAPSLPQQAISRTELAQHYSEAEYLKDSPDLDNMHSTTKSMATPNEPTYLHLM